MLRLKNDVVMTVIGTINEVYPDILCDIDFVNGLTKQSERQYRLEEPKDENSPFTLYIDVSVPYGIAIDYIYRGVAVVLLTKEGGDVSSPEVITARYTKLKVEVDAKILHKNSEETVN